jgi:hypothetical protein
MLLLLMMMPHNTMQPVCLLMEGPAAATPAYATPAYATAAAAAAAPAELLLRLSLP